MIEISEYDGRIYLIKINLSEIYTLSVPELKENIQKEILNKNIDKLIIDLSSVNTITSSGLGIFLNINKSLKSELRLANPSPDVLKVLELTKVTSVVKIFDTIDMAIESFSD